MTHHLQHGSILGGVVTVPDITRAITDYRDILQMQLIEEGVVSADLARAWGCANIAGNKMAVLQPRSGADCFIRLVEQPSHPEFVPTTSYGWAAYELTVQDVFGWPDRLTGSSFDIIGPPKELDILPFFVPMQVLGPGREMVYLNEVRVNTPSSDLPEAKSITDHIFIVILATPDREASVKWYCDRLKLEEADTYTLEYSMINEAFGKPAGTTSKLTMVQNGKLPIVEVDDYPDEAAARPRHEGMLPPGNAMVSLGVDSLDALDLKWLAKPVARDAAPYSGRRAASVTGPAGELIELIEIG